MNQHKITKAGTAAAVLFCALLSVFAKPADAASISVLEEAAQYGERGMRVYMDEPRPGYVQDNTPIAETRYRARFYIRVDELNIPEGEFIDVLVGYDGGNVPEFVVRLIRVSNQVYLTYAASDTGGILTGYAESQRVLLLDGWHYFEIDWSTGPGTGSLLVYFDGFMKNGVTNLNNAGGSLEYVRFGAASVPAAEFSGHFDLDDFMSRETDYIGGRPIAFPIPTINVNVNAANTVGNLIGRFLDNETSYINLTYSVAAVSNAALFSGVFINAAARTIILDYEQNATGTSEVTVRATDSDGLYADSTFTVNVNGPPTTTAIADIEVEANAPDIVISLWDVFDDVEDTDQQLNYSIANNTDPGIFSGTAIDLVAGTLTLGFVPDAPGSAEITLRATDSGGLHANATFTVTVTQSAFHNADTNQDNALNLSELLRVIQFFNSGISCANPPGSTEDGFVPLIGGDQSCTPHSSDYNPQSWSISLSELLRVVQIFNSAGYTKCPGGEDGFCLL